MIKLNIDDRVERIQLLLTLSRGAKSRRSILKTLLLKPKNCSQIAREVKLDWWTVQRHLRILLKEQIVECSTFGNSKYYRLPKKGKEAIRIAWSDDKNEFDEQDQICIKSVSGSNESRGKLNSSKLNTSWVCIGSESAKNTFYDSVKAINDPQKRGE